MRTTGLGALLTGMAWIAMLAAFLLGTLAPAIVAVTLLGGLEAARRGVRRSPVQVRRTLPERMEVGQQATLRIDATSQRPLPLWVEQEADVPLRVVARRHGAGRGHAWQELDVQAVESGTATWRTATVRYSDAWGLHESVRELGAVDALPVAPEAHWLTTGRREGQRQAVQTVVRGKRHFETTPQVEAVREFQPGDRMRDVDWARSSRMQTLHSRVRERVLPRPVTVLLDATATMRHHRRRAKITTGARIAYGVLAAAQGAGVLAQVIVADERGMLRAGSGRGMGQAMAQLGRLDALVPVDALPVAGDAEGRPEDRGFLGAVSLLHLGRTPPAAPLDAATVELSRRDPSLIVAILDAEVDPVSADGVVRRLRQAGHDVLLVAPATGAHHVRRSEAPGMEDRLEGYLDVRRRLAKRLDGIGVPLISAGPHDVERVVREVARWAK